MKTSEKILSEWDDGLEEYVEVGLNETEAVCVKCTCDGFCYVLDCENGMNVYPQGFGSDVGVRLLTHDEYNDVIAFVKKEKGYA